MFCDSALVCENCTLTLLDAAEDLQYYLESEMNRLDLNGIPAPWPRLISYENSVDRFTKKLNDYLEAKAQLSVYDNANIDKVSDDIEATDTEKPKYISSRDDENR